ncbi:PQQ-binding-like beta-propeller repeat protein [Streptomyces sp. NPDC048584]|uniref:outer membrane protein assembly factor BamB family protein n=1 Tax=Streptomyces sp. NPDC048584 TaxID=3365573 RepID=UPI00371947ED
MTEKAIGEFSRLRPVGEGTLGYTYRGVAPDGSFWAVKELHPDWGPPRETWQRVEEVLWRFRRLREAPNRTVHRHTVDTVGGYDHGTDRAWVATRWLGADPVAQGSHAPAVSLAHALASGPSLPPGAALYLMWQLSNLAQQLDTLGLTLSGLKPSNLFLTADGVVVVDLHLALRLRSLLRGPGTPRPPFLWADVEWLAPELRRADAVPRLACSIYALGAVTAFACTGVPPFPTIDVIDALTHRKDNRRAVEDALANWAAYHGSAGTRLRRAATRSLRQRPRWRPGAKRLGRLIVPPLWGTHRRPVYRDAWSEYVRSALLRRLAEEVPGPDTGARSAQREQEEQRPAVSAPHAVRSRPPVVSAGSTVPGTRQPATVQGTPTPTPAPAPTPTPTAVPTPTPTPVPVAVSGPEHSRASAAPTPPPVPADHGTRVLSPVRTDPLWTWEPDGPFSSAPLVMDSQLVVTCEGSAHILDAATGSLALTLSLPGTAESTPVFWAGRLWWALRDGELSGHELGVRGREIRLRLDGDPGRHSPVVAGDRLLIGTTHGLFAYEPPGRDGTSTGLRLIWLDEPVVSPLATDGIRLWVPTEARGLIAVRLTGQESRGPHPAWDSAGCAPALTTEGAYIGDARGTVHELTAEGTSRRRWQVSARPVTAPPAVHGDLLLVTDHAGTVVALSLAHGDEVWRTSTDGDGRSAPTVTDDVVYVRGARTVRRLEVRTGRELTPLTPDGPAPTDVTAASGLLHVSFADGRLSTWCPLK